MQTVADLCKGYIEHRRCNIKRSTAARYEGMMKKYIMSGCETPYEPRRIEYNWKCFCKSAGLRDVKFHTLRHTFATTALEAGVDVKTLSEMLGHATVSTTMDLYCHPTLKHKQECMSKIWE